MIGILDLILALGATFVFWCVLIAGGTHDRGHPHGPHLFNWILFIPFAVAVGLGVAIAWLTGGLTGITW